MILPCSESWGAQTLVWSDPAVEVFTDVLYVPLTHKRDISQDGEWGLFRSDGSLIETAAYRRGPQGQMVGHPLRTPVRASDLAFEDGEEWVYSGPLLLHYGHFVTASIARLWNASLLAGEKTRFLCHGQGSPDAWAKLPYTRGVFDALNISAEQFVQYDRPVRLRRVVVPRPGFEEQNFAHRAFGALCHRIGRAILGDRSVSPNDRPAYLSKSRLAAGVGRFSDEADIEAVLSAEGVEIIHPQELSFAEQVELFEERTLILGTLGSAFHTAAFVRPGGRSVCLAPISAVNSNFYLIDKACGRKASYYYPNGGIVQTSTDEGFLSSFRLAKPREVAESLLRTANGSSSAV